MELLDGATADRPRRVFNNALVHLAALPDLSVPTAEHAQSDGNLYWSPKADAKAQARTSTVSRIE